MKPFKILTAALLCLTPFANLPADSHSSSSSHSSKTRKAVGTFNLVARGKDGIIFLDNNKCYTPDGDVNRQRINSWSTSDSIRVLKTKRKHRYILADLNNGETAETKLSPRVKKVVGVFPLIAKGEDQRVLLGNNTFYKPVGDTNEEKVTDWDLGDSIKVLKSKKHHYLLVDMSIGELVMTDISNINLSSSSHR